MAKITKKIGFTVEIDEDEIVPANWRVWIYQFLNRINYEHKIISLEVDGMKVDITDPDQLYNLPLGEDQDIK